MNRILVGIVGLVIIGLAGIAAANKAVDSLDPAMMVSPSTIVLDKVFTITVHTNIPFREVVPESIALDNAEPTSLFADDCGHLVAKFEVADLELAPGEVNTLTLGGDYEEGGSFSATDQVRVK
jgi:hypothetical protein